MYYAFLLLCIFMVMKKMFALPTIWLSLGIIAIATEINAGDLLPTAQPLSWTVLLCIKDAVEAKENTLISATTSYQEGNLTALIAKKKSVLAAWQKSTKWEIQSSLAATSKTYKKAIESLKKELKISKKSAMVLYKNEVKRCKSTWLQDLVDVTTQDD